MFCHSPVFGLKMARPGEHLNARAAFPVRSAFHQSAERAGSSFCIEPAFVTELLDLLVANRLFTEEEDDCLRKKKTGRDLKGFPDKVTETAAFSRRCKSFVETSRSLQSRYEDANARRRLWYYKQVTQGSVKASYPLVQYSVRLLCCAALSVYMERQG